MDTIETRLETRPGHISPDEWAVRVDLAACYRLVAHFGWDDLIFTHLSARVPGPEHHFLINPYGMMFDEITASSLVKVDLTGRIVLESEYHINPAGFTIHSAVHAAREDALCVMHLHTVEGVAVSIQKEGLRALSQQSIFPLASIAYHDYEGVALNPQGFVPMLDADGERLTQSLAIISWLEWKYPAPVLLPAEPALRSQNSLTLPWSAQSLRCPVTRRFISAGSS